MSENAVLEVPGLGKIKMVVWDLDETFWQGIITEGGVTYLQAHHDLVIALALRGVVSAICSNNDLAPVQAFLEEKGLWSYFVFPQVSWQRKGPLVQGLIDAAQLRPMNVLFVDDKLSNLDEVQQCCPGILTALPERIAELTAQVATLPVTDAGLKRLQQYKVLETKALARDHALRNGASSHDFLRQSGISVRLLRGADAPVARIVEMIQRTNQLNFTKARPSAAEVSLMLQSPDWDAACVEVWDKYGQYGVAGFYAVQLQDGKRHLRHFLFSCRILNMGVEAWLYQHLQTPVLPDGMVSNGFDSAAPVDWVTLAQLAPQSAVNSASALKRLRRTLSNAPGVALYALYQVTQRLPALRTGVLWSGAQWSRVWRGAQPGRRTGALLRGGCDTWAIGDFLQAEGVAARRENGEWRQTLEALRFPEAQLPWSTLAQAMSWSGDLSFAHGSHTGNLFAGYETVVISLARDYKAGLYRYHDTSLLLPLPPFDLNLTDPANRSEVLSWASRFGLASGPWQVPVFTGAGLAWLTENCQPLSLQARRDRVLENILWCAARAAPGVKLIFILPPETAPAEIYPMWRNIAQEAALLNPQVRQAVAGLANVRLLAVQDLLGQPGLLVDRHPYHYARSVHRELAQRLMQIRRDWQVC